MATVEIKIPYKARQWAKALHEQLLRFGVLVLHRRAGKTTALINHFQRAALSDEWEAARLRRVRPSLLDSEIKELLKPPGGRHYGLVLPLRNQAKLVVWDRLKFYVPKLPGLTINEAELLIRYPTGNKLQLFGADNPDALRGPAFSGVAFDEYSQQPANLFSEIISKALADHLGFAVFAGTIKGKDHLFQMYETVKDDPHWLSVWQDVDKSIATEDGITVQLLEQAMSDDRAQIAQGLMTQDEYDQEWYLSHEAAIKGAIYGAELLAVRQAGRITAVPHDPALPVETYWDLGMHLAIWFVQSTRGGEIRLIEYWESGDSASLPEAAQVLFARPYTYSRHVAPHDVVVRELGSGRSRLESAKALGIFFEVAPRLELRDGIHAVKLLLPRCYFDAEKTHVGLDMLRQYRRKWNSRLQEFEATPEHNFASHGADAFRYLAVSHRAPVETKRPKEAAPLPDLGGSAWMT